MVHTIITIEDKLVQWCREAASRISMRKRKYLRLRLFGASQCLSPDYSKKIPFFLPTKSFIAWFTIQKVLDETFLVVFQKVSLRKYFTWEVVSFTDHESGIRKKSWSQQSNIIMFQIFTDTKFQFVAFAASLYTLSGCYVTYIIIIVADLSRIWIYQVSLVS